MSYFFCLSRFYAKSRVGSEGVTGLKTRGRPPRLDDRIKDHIQKIRMLAEVVAFTAGFDGTVLSKSFQIHYSSDGNSVVGGVYPNHFLPLPQNNSCNDDCNDDGGDPQLQIFCASVSMERKGKRHLRLKYVCCPSNVPLPEQLRITHLLVIHSPLISKATSDRMLLMLVSVQQLKMEILYC